MTPNWLKFPPLMQRTLADDLRAAAAVLAGVVLAMLVFGADDVGGLVGAVVGLVVVIAVLSVVRHIRRRRA